MHTCVHGVHTSEKGQWMSVFLIEISSETNKQTNRIEEFAGQTEVGAGFFKYQGIFPKEESHPQGKL